MCEIRINFDQVEKAIAVMRAAQIRRDGYDKAGHRDIRADELPVRIGELDYSVFFDRMSISDGGCEADTRICRYKL